MQYILYYKYRQKSLEGRRRFFFVLCRVALYNTRQMNTLSSVRILTLGKPNICRVLHSRLTAKLISVTASSVAGVTWGHVPSLPSARRSTLGKIQFCRVPSVVHSANRIFAECFYFAECLFYYTRYTACLLSARDTALGKPVDTRQQCGLWQCKSISIDGPFL